MILLEAAEDAFPTNRAEDFRWQAARPGSSGMIDLVCSLERQGFVTLHDVEDPADHRVYTRVRLTATGNRRIKELSDAGVEPSSAADANDEP